MEVIFFALAPILCMAVVVVFGVAAAVNVQKHPAAAALLALITSVLAVVGWTTVRLLVFGAS